MPDFPKIKRLLPSRPRASAVTKADIAASMQSAAKLLKSGKDVGRLQVRLMGEESTSRGFTFDVLAGECQRAGRYVRRSRPRARPF